MLPGNVDPRRPDKQQRYKPPPASNNAAPGEDLTPDYMNILDPQRKSMQTSCRSDRFKVVKIESTEPFKRGRWECMDFLDQSYNRVYQRNCNNARQVSSDTHARPVSPNFYSELHKSLTSNSDLQSSMLQIFYKQNNSIFDTNNTVCIQQTIVQTCKRKYQNHVLRPGMVSSSLVGIKYPFELNFEKDESSPSNGTCCKNRPAIISDCHVPCDNQKFQSMSSDYTNLSVYQNLNPELLNNGQYIENTVPQPQPYPEIYQEQIITYVDNCLPQQRITTNTTEVYTTLNQPNYIPQPNYVVDSNQQQFSQQILDNSIQNNDAPQVLYHPNPRFQADDQYSPAQTESQIQSNIMYQNDQINNSVISTNSYENFVPNKNVEYGVQNQFETQLKPVLQEVFEHRNPPPNPTNAPMYVPNNTQPVQPSNELNKQLDMSACVRSFLRDERNIIACTNQSRSNESIDAKIEQLMDLVKKHLKYAVLEDVNVMKQQILILKGRVAQLEYENALLRSCETKCSKRQDDI